MILKYITSLFILVLINQYKQCYRSFIWASLPVALFVGFPQALVANAKVKFSSR